MLGKQELKDRKSAFWLKLEQRMELVKPPHGTKTSWLTPNTRVRHLYFRMEFDQNGARLCIDMQHKDPELRALVFDQFEEFKTMLETALEAKCYWQRKHVLAESGAESSRISIERKELDFYQDESWPEALDFFSCIPRTFALLLGRGQRCFY